MAHLEAEEENLIPWLLPRSERAARVIVQEHRHIRARSKELDAAMASHEATLDTVRDFSDELRAHSQSEERLLYRWTDTHLDEPQRMLAIEALTV
jgi:hypothetical protein